MTRLTFKKDNGNCEIVGMNKDNEDKKMYAVASKLLDYEETGLSPEDVERVNDFANSQLVKVMAELQKYRDIQDQCGYDIGTAVHELSGEILRLKDENIILHNQLMETEKELLRIRDECDSWKSEAIKHCADAGEQKIKLQQVKCAMCKLEDTSKCNEC